MEQILAYLSYSPYVLFGLATLGFLIDLWRKKPRAPAETAANLSIFLVDQVLRATIFGGAVTFILKPFAALAPWHMPANLWSLGLAVVLVDALFYWKHRAAHQIRLLWAFHSVHHSSSEYNLSTALRLPWFGASIDALFYIPAVLVGFSPAMVFLGKILGLLYQYGIHTEAVGRLGWLDKIFNTPSNHRVHHASNDLYLDKNHGGILIVWDRLFGTYQAELADVKVQYGLTTPIDTRNPLKINSYEIRALFFAVIRSHSVADAWRHLSKGPGWTAAATATDLHLGEFASEQRARV